jgi:hypothetical protein
MLEMGVPVGAGTDATRVSSYNPYLSLYWLITGKAVGGLSLYPQENRLDREEALKLYTMGSSWFSTEDGKKGALAPGQLADLAVLSWSSIARAVSDHLHLKRPTEEESLTYNVLQRLAYLAVVFLFFSLIILTGLAMSPAITSAVPTLVTIFGGQQSARTIHFFIANFLVLFLLVHIAMVCLAGFTKRVRAMITGHSAARKEPF